MESPLHTHLLVKRSARRHIYSSEEDEPEYGRAAETTQVEAPQTTPCISSEQKTSTGSSAAGQEEDDEGTLIQFTCENSSPWCTACNASDAESEASPPQGTNMGSMKN